jgi:hypothetical protein
LLHVAINSGRVESFFDSKSDWRSEDVHTFWVKPGMKTLRARSFKGFKREDIPNLFIKVRKI